MAGFEVYEEYLQVMEGAGNIVYLKEGDVLSLLGLNMEVFHSFDAPESLMIDTTRNAPAKKR